MIRAMSTGWNAPLAPRPRHDALVLAISAVARAAGARLMARDAGDGFLTLPGAQRANLASQGNRFGELCAVTLEAWKAAAAEPDGVALAALGELAARPEEKILLALAAAIQLDRGTAKALAFCAPGGRLTVGAVLDLMATSPTNRTLLTGLLHPEAPLAASGAIAVAGDDVPGVDADLTVAPSVLAVVRGEPPARPFAAEQIGYRPDAGAAALLDAMELRGVRPGGVTVLAGPRTATVPLMHLLLLGRGQVGWMLPPPPAVSGLDRDLSSWRRWALTAALAGRVLVVDAEGERLDGAVVLARAAAAATGAAIAVLTPTDQPAVDGPTLTIVPAVGLATALPDPPASATPLLASMVAALRGAS